MRKLFLSLLLVAGLSETVVATTISVDSAIFIQEKQYKKIQVSEVSKEAMEKIKKSYGAYTIKEASRASDGEYKLVLAKDGVDLTATFTSAGDLIKIY